MYGFRTTSIKKILFYCVGEVTGKENYLLIFESASEFKEWPGSGSYSQYSW